MAIRINQLIGGLLVMMTGVSQSYAGISLDRTRLIITGAETSSSANLSNTSPSIPFLAQSWVEDANGKKITSPLVVLPPLQRINGGQKGVARVSKTAEIDKLPQDRESLFYLNVREVPPKPDKANVLQLAMQSRIKLFYRPTAIIPESKSAVWQDKITFQKQGSNWRAENPTPYYVTIISLNDKLTTEGGKKLTDFPGVMIAPKSNLDIKVNGAGENFTMMYVNDYGGHPELKYRCSGNTCTALPTEQQLR